MEAIRIENLTKKYGKLTAVDSLSLTVESGTVFSLLGVNGAGKTTTIKMLSTLTVPTSGDAFLMGHSIITDGDEVKRIIAVSPQETAVAPGLTAEENLRLICGVNGFSKEKTAAKVAEITDKLGLGEIASKKAGKLSGGWQRRLSIGMALVSESRILFLDEPTLGLDVIARSELWDIIRELKKTATVILTTHYMEEAEALSDKIAIMRDGVLLTVDTADGIKAQAGCDSFEESFIAIVRGATK